MPRVTSLDVLPGSGGSLVRRSNGRESEAVPDVAGGDGGVVGGSEDLPLGVTGHNGGVGGGAGHEAVLVGPAAEGAVLTGLVGEALSRGARGKVAGVRGGERESALGVDVDALAAGDSDVLDSGSVVVG